MKDFYYILGVDANCTDAQVKEAYRKLSKKFHPDLNQEDKYFESHFREVHKAYEILSDPLKRGQYDAALKKSKSGTSEQAYKKQAAYSGYKPPVQPNKPNPVSTKSTTKVIDITFSIILISITFIFAVVNTVTLNPSSLHKKKHKTKVDSAAINFGYSAPHSTLALPFHIIKPMRTNIPAPRKVKPLPQIQPVPIPKIKQLPQNKPAAVQQIQPVAKAVKKILPTDDFLYTTYISGNLTGVINMRKIDNFSSEIIKAIPTGSKVFVEKKGAVYYKVRFNNVVGYVPRWTLEAK
jgi:hypothetical protein